jgi:F-type H+-transporting ATPase subunit epsilon
MSSSAAASSYWRVAGMSYLKYANLCADMVRSSLKEPTKSKAKLREAVYYRAATWKDGKPEKQGRSSVLMRSQRIGCDPSHIATSQWMISTTPAIASKMATAS